MKKLWFLLMLILVIALFPVRPVSADQAFFWDVCRFGNSDYYQTEVRNAGDTTAHLGYILQSNPGAIHDLGVLSPGQTARDPFVANPTDGIYSMYFSEGQWHPGVNFRWLGAPLTDCNPSTPTLGTVSILGPVPGCDQFMPTGPLVSFTRDVNLYWAPRADAVTPYMVRSGQTAKLVSADGDYIKIVWVCDLLWVPAWGVARD